MDGSLRLELGFLPLTKQNSADLAPKANSKSKKMRNLWGKPIYTEREIIDGIEAGSEEMFTYLYNRFKKQVIRYVLDHGGSRDQGKDLLQDTILSIFQYDYSNYNFNNRFEPFFVVFYKNAWKNQLRTASRRPVTQSLESTREYEPEDYGFQRSLDVAGNLRETQVKQKIIDQSISKLSPSCQELLKLFFVDGLDPGEVAEYLGISYGAAKKRKHDCLLRLKKIIKKDSNR